MHSSRMHTAYLCGHHWGGGDLCPGGLCPGLSLHLTEVFRLKLSRETLPLTEAYRLKLNQETLPLTEVFRLKLN